ncbi:hypothetical protein HDU97_009038 [Phlyctochytrium planicorne]|nr:hypothetical protein HDU97_009038 [Phlyctochytrium planicorne]
MAPVASVTSVGSAVGLMNIVSMWVGSIPSCHGSGGLAGQYRFGARTHVSVVLLGIAKVAVDLLFGSALIKILASFPNTVLGVMLCLSGIEIAAMMKDVGGTDARAYNRIVIVIVTGGVCAAWKNDGVGFSVGAVTTFILWIMDRKEKGESVLELLEMLSDRKRRISLQATWKLYDRIMDSTQVLPYHQMEKR